MIRPLILGMLIVAVIMAAALMLRPEADEPGLARPGVTLNGTDVGGLAAGEVWEIVDVLAAGVEMEPAEPYYDPGSRAVVPGYSGVWVNRQVTVERVMAAVSGSRLSLVATVVPPDKTVWEFPAPAIYHGHPDRPTISLLVNVAWGEEHLPDLLEALESHGVHATFAVMGTWLERNPDWGLRIARAGHELANHGFHDVHPGQLGQDELRREIEATNQLALTLGLPVPRIYTPHYGERTDQILFAAREMGLVTVFWSVDTLDWMKPAPEEMASRVGRLMHPGAIILLHPTPVAVAGLRLFLPDLMEQGYRPVTLSRLLTGAPCSRTAGSPD